MNLRITNFTLMALLSSAAFGMDIQTPDDPPKVRMLINGQVRDVIIATTAQMGPMALIRNQYQRPTDNDDTPENAEFKKLLSANTERMGVVPHLYARSLLQLDYHDEMIELLTSELSALEKLKIYEGKGNSNYAIEIVSKDMDTLKEKNLLNKRKNFKCVFNNLFQQNIKEKGRVINQSNLQHIYQTLNSSQIERKINQTEFDIPGSTDTSTAIFEELASVYVEYFLNVERGQASLYGTFTSSIYEHLDKTAEEIMDLIAPFSAFTDPSNKIKMGVVEPGVSGVLNAKGQLNRMEISHLLKSHVHSFVPSFYKQFNQTIGTYEFKRIERKSTISFKNIVEKEELPLQLNKEKYARTPSKAELKLEEKYRKEFKKALKARNDAFNTPRTQEDLVSIDHKRARNGLAVLYAAYTKFEDTKIDLRDKYQAEYDLLLLAPETILPSTSDREATNATTESPLRMIDQVAELIDSAAMPAVAELGGNSAAIVGVESDTLTMSATSTAEERKERKPKRWHERGDDSDMQQARAPAATTSIFETTYLYTDQAEWPEWIKALKSDRQFDESAILRGFTSSFAEGGLGGTIFEDNNKYLLMFESPFNKDILPKNRFYTAKAHALHKGTGDKRYPAIRKALIEMLEEAHIIPR